MADEKMAAPVFCPDISPIGHFFQDPLVSFAEWESNAGLEFRKNKS